MVSKIWDAVSDPLMGVISDNTRGKWGRRRPYLVIGGIFTPLVFMFMFAPIGTAPMGLKVTCATLAYLLVCTVSTVSQVPYCSLVSEISSNFKERNMANSFKIIFSMLGAAVCFLIPSNLLENHIRYLDGGSGITSVQFFLVLGLGFGLIFALSLILSGVFTKERIPYDPNIKSKFAFSSYKEPLRCKSYRQQIVMYISAFLCMDIISALAVYYVVDIMQGVKIFGQPAGSMFIIAPMMVMAGLMFPLVQFARAKKTKQFAYRMGIPCYVVGGLVMAFFPAMREGGPTWIIPLSAVLMGIGFGGAQMMPWLMFPDVMDVVELKTGIKDTGIYSGLLTFARKLSTALAIFLVGLALQLAGYDKKQAVQSLDKEGLFWTIRIIFAASIVILMSLAAYTSFRYKITDKKLVRVKHFLDIQREGRNDELTPEEAAEKEALLKELY
jgi:Na+/melibiose symporter-like transporter